MTRDPVVTSRIMSAVRSQDTQPELLLRRELHRRGLRYRIHVKMVPGCPDIVFTRARLAVFVDGDFWHGHGWRERGFDSMEAQFARQRDPEKWIRKIERNVARDREVQIKLSELGWRAIRIRESFLHADLKTAADRVVTALFAPE